MSEENKKVELKDEDLRKETGGKEVKTLEGYSVNQKTPLYT